LKSIAIIGTGISGSLVARLLSTQHDVTVFEANDYPGGHANTVDVSVEGKRFSVDTGFMVFNRRTYPNFCQLLELLEVKSQPSDMSFSVRCEKTGLEYQGSSLNGLFAQRLNSLRPSFLCMLRDIARFNRLGMRAAASGELKDGRPVRDFVRECGLGSRFVDQYLVPMAAAIWSSSPRAILDFPADFMLRFFANHGLMQLRDRPQWRTIVGGSRNYVETLLEPLWNRVRLHSPIASVTRSENDVIVKPVDGPRERFDEVVFASHADQSLKMLADASRSERQILGAFPYQPNVAVLHTDTRLLPQRPRAWASWNYCISANDEQSASLTYDLSRLQGHDSSTPILLTLNSSLQIAPEKVLQTFSYHHPAYSRESITAQRRFKQISSRRHTHYCGAYWGYGFHEDGVNSALAVAAHFGIGLDACTAVSTKEPLRIAVASQ
jgi:predicted NAD/FAD-binding protein